MGKCNQKGPSTREDTSHGVTKAASLPIIKLVQMVTQILDSAILYGLGTVRKRHATYLKELDATQEF